MNEQLAAITEALSGAGALLAVLAPVAVFVSSAVALLR